MQIYGGNRKILIKDTIKAISERAKFLNETKIDGNKRVEIILDYLTKVLQIHL